MLRAASGRRYCHALHVKSLFSQLASAHELPGVLLLLLPAPLLPPRKVLSNQDVTWSTTVPLRSSGGGMIVIFSAKYLTHDPTQSSATTDCMRPGPAPPV